MARIVESGFDDMDDACGMSVVRRLRPQQQEVIFFSSGSSVAACCRAVKRRCAIPENEIKQMFTSKSCRADATSSCCTEGFFLFKSGTNQDFFCCNIFIDFPF